MRRLFTLLLLTLSLAAGSAFALTNQLKGSTSPYLALHATDPVAWQEWNAQVLARAKRENKPILLSLGYFSCQGCHRMQIEALQNAEVAQFLNAYFIPVLVDREIMTALDAELQAFALRTQGLSGWPLNIILTPEGHPLDAFFYVTPQQMLQTLSYAQARWESGHETILKEAREAAGARLAVQPRAEKITLAVARKYRDKFLIEVFEVADTYRGGFGSGAKYPMAPQLGALLTLQHRAPDPRLEKFLRTWLDWMADEGLYDHLGGGFFRYTTDAEWRAPHFEKMLADNAQLALIYLDAAEMFRQPRYRKVAFGALDFLVAEMRDGRSGAFMASSSAVDEQHRAGAYYQWSKDELKRLLSAEEYTLVAKLWDMERRAPGPYGYFPVNRIKPTEAETPMLQAIHRKLAEARKKRTLQFDSKQVASLNGLALQAFSRAAREDKRYLPHARKLRKFALGTLWRDGELAKGMNRGKRIGRGELEDYAYLADGLLAWAKVANDEAAHAAAREMLVSAWQSFHGAEGWKTQKQSLLAGRRHQLLVEDWATPSPSAALIAASLHSGDAVLIGKARKALERGHEMLDDKAFWHATQVSLLQE